MMASAPFKKSTLREYFESIVIAVILALFIRTFIVQAFKIPTGSMEENLLIGDHLLVNKFVFAPTASALERTLLPIAQVKRDDIVVFKYPEEPDRDFIKRVIGLPGETVEVREKKVYINGKPIDEPFVHFLQPVSTESVLHEVTSFDVRERYGPVTVPPDQYFVMGDNRDDSLDSRTQLQIRDATGALRLRDELGWYVPAENLVGRAEFIFFSHDPSAAGWLEPWKWPQAIRFSRFFQAIH